LAEPGPARVWPDLAGGGDVEDVHRQALLVRQRALVSMIRTTAA
jgi:hypothetical protein